MPEMNPRTDADHTPGAHAAGERRIRRDPANPTTASAHCRTRHRGISTTDRRSSPPQTAPPPSRRRQHVAYELGLGSVLRWPIVSRSTVQDGLYHYDAIARLQDVQIAAPQGPGSVEGIGSYIRLGPLGTALLPSDTPRVLLIDELDKSDIDLPNDLPNVLEEGEFAIPELERVADRLPGDEALTDDRAKVTAARRAPPHPPHTTMNDLPLPRFLGRTGSSRPTRKSALPGELPMPDQDPTPATHTTGDTENRIVSFRWPGKPTLSTGACFTYAFTLGGILATGRITDPTRAWQLVVLAVTSMACGATLAITQHTHRHSADN